MFQAGGSEVEFRPLVELRLWFTNQKSLRDRGSGGPSGVPPLDAWSTHTISMDVRSVEVYKDVGCTNNSI